MNYKNIVEKLKGKKNLYHMD